MSVVLLVQFVHSAVVSPNTVPGKQHQKVPKFSYARKCNSPKIQTKRPNLKVFCQKHANGIANSEDPDQTTPLGAVWSESALFTQTYLSENLGLLQ